MPKLDIEDLILQELDESGDFKDPDEAYNHFIENEKELVEQWEEEH